jgi:thiamine kinase-like enzyme
MIDWKDIEIASAKIDRAIGGWSQARRGSFVLNDGSKGFLKQGVSDDTKAWANREVEVYKWLNNIRYQHAPELKGYTDGAFVIQDLSDCDFTNSWDSEKLAAAVAAMETLYEQNTDGIDIGPIVFPNGWEKMSHDQSIASKLIPKLGSKYSSTMLQDIKGHVSRFDTLFSEVDYKPCHGDARGDNFGYDIVAKTGMLVDWNWLALAPVSFDMTAFLVSVEKSGFRVPEQLLDKYVTADSACVLAGFWLNVCTEPIWEGGDPALRDHQLVSGLLAWKWYQERRL